MVGRLAPALHALFVCQQIEHRGAAQGGITAADQLAQGRVGFFDQAVLIAGDQHVAHGGQQAENELLRLLQLGVLFFQLDLIGHQLGIDLVHFVDDVQPGRLVNAFEFNRRQLLQR